LYFAVFAGLSYVDVKRLTQDDIKTSFDGGLWIMGKRRKTDTGYNVPLLDISKRILDKYKNTLPGGKALFCSGDFYPILISFNFWE
jgi:hypothetical protein